MGFISLIQFVVAQNYVHEFGKYSNEEFQLTQYDKDPLAEAVVIYDIGSSEFNRTDNGFEIFFQRRMKIKILTQAGLKWAQISIPYYEEDRRFEEISELKGNTYNFENGTIRCTSLNTKNTFNEKYNEHWYNKKFAMPDVKVGSVFEVSYKIRSPYIFNFRNWDFQTKIPVIYSEYTTKMIPFYEYQYILQGAGKFDEFKSYVDPGIAKNLGSLNYQDMVYFYVMKDLPAFRDESFITSPYDYIVKLDFQLAAIHRPSGATEKIMSTWLKLSADLIDNENFGKYLKGCKKNGKVIIDTMHLASKSIIEKTKIIERFVKNRFSWNGNIDKYASKSVKDFLTSKTGNCTDINLFLTGMLNAAGIDAYPVILSTRGHGKIKADYPFLHFFNYVVVLANFDNVSVLLDATDPFSNFSEIPPRCINDRGLVIEKNKEEWVSLKSDPVSNILYDIGMHINNSRDSVTQHCKLITTGYEALDYRNRYTKLYEKLKDNLLGNNALKSDTLKAIDLYKVGNPFEIDFNFKTSLEKVEDKIIIAPFSKFIITENPLKQSYRNYPVDFTYKKVYKYQSTIEIPKGYKLLSKPENLIINNKMMRIIYVTDILDTNSIKVIGTYEFMKDEYAPLEYLELKNYLSQIVEKFNEKVVMVKTEE